MEWFPPPPHWVFLCSPSCPDILGSVDQADLELEKSLREEIIFRPSDWRQEVMALLEAGLLAGKEKAWFRGSRLMNLNKPRGEFILLLKPLIGIGGAVSDFTKLHTNKPSALVANDLKINDFFPLFHWHQHN